MSTLKKASDDELLDEIQRRIDSGELKSEDLPDELAALLTLRRLKPKNKSDS